MKRRKQKILNKKKCKKSYKCDACGSTFPIFKEYQKHVNATWNAKGFYLIAVNSVNMWDMTKMDFKNIYTSNLVVNSSIRKKK